MYSSLTKVESNWIRSQWAVPRPYQLANSDEIAILPSMTKHGTTTLGGASVEENVDQDQVDGMAGIGGFQSRALVA